MKKIFHLLIIWVFITGCASNVLELDKKYKFKTWNQITNVKEKLENSWQVIPLGLYYYDNIPTFNFHKKYRLTYIYKDLLYLDDFKVKTYEYNKEDTQDFTLMPRILNTDKYSVTCDGYGQNLILVENKQTKKRKALYSRVGIDGSCKDEISLLDNDIILYTALDEDGKWWNGIRIYSLKEKKLLKEIKVAYYYGSINRIYTYPNQEFVLVRDKKGDFYLINIFPISRTYKKYLLENLKNKSLKDKVAFLEKNSKYFILDYQFQLYYDLKYKLISKIDKLNQYYKFLRDTKGYIIKVRVGNVRNRPSIHSNIIGKITKDTLVDIIEKRGKWYKIKYRNAYGWIYQSLLKKSYIKYKIFKKYKSLVLRRIKDIEYRIALNSNNIKKIQQYIDKYGMSSTIKNHLLTLYRNKKTTKFLLKAYKLSHSVQDLKLAYKYAKTYNDNLIVEQTIVNSISPSKLLDIKVINSIETKPVKKQLRNALSAVNLSVKDIKKTIQIRANPNSGIKLKYGSYKIHFKFILKRKYSLNSFVGKGKYLEKPDDPIEKNIIVTLNKDNNYSNIITIDYKDIPVYGKFRHAMTGLISFFGGLILGQNISRDSMDVKFKLISTDLQYKIMKIEVE